MPDKIERLATSALIAELVELKGAVAELAVSRPNRSYGKSRWSRKTRWII
jgi:hypothetical protein